MRRTGDAVGVQSAVTQVAVLCPLSIGHRPDRFGAGIGVLAAAIYEHGKAARTLASRYSQLTERARFGPIADQMIRLFDQNQHEVARSWRAERAAPELPRA